MYKNLCSVALLAILSGGYASVAQAQLGNLPTPSPTLGSLPSPPAVPTGLPPSTGALHLPTPTAQPAVHAPSRIGQFFRGIGHAHAKLKAKVRSSPLGDIARGVAKPVSKLTGGIVPAQGKPNHVEMAAPGPQGHAAKIKHDQLNAPKRLAAIKALGEVDCHWYPEAQAQLLTALRTDRDECVRFKAAEILSQSQCCTAATVQALRICVAGTELDGNPGERSLRIRTQAAIALERCLARCGDRRSDAPASPSLLRPEYPLGQLPTNPIGTGSEQSESQPVISASFGTSVADSANDSAQTAAAPARQPSQDELATAQRILAQFQVAKESSTREANDLWDAWQKAR